MADGAGQLPPSAEEGTIDFPPFRLERLGGRLWSGEHLVPLKPKAFSLLEALLEQPGRLLTQEELLVRLWGDVRVSEGVLKTQISELRLALGDSAREPRFIQTVHRRGYRFIAAVRPRARAAAQPKLPALPQPLMPEHFTGRQPELELLAAAWNRARQGQRGMVLVTGEAGVGKTALVNTFLRRLPQAGSEPALLAWGQCIGQYGVGEPFLPLIEALRRCCAGPYGDAVADCLRSNAPSWLSLLPCAQPLPADSALLVTPGRMLRELVETLELLSARQPIALLLEDLHWADHSTLELLGYLARRSDPARLLVLGTYRPGEAPGAGLAQLATLLQSHRAGCELPVPQLSQRAVSEYLDLRFGQHQLPAAVPALIHERTAGNALYLVGLIDAWLKRGLLRNEQGSCTIAAELTELASCIPDGLARMVEGELEGLSTLERSVLEAASVAGAELSTATVAAALDADELAVEELCGRWARHGQFLRSEGAATWDDGTVAEQFQFRHVLYQQVVYQQLGTGRRARWHLRIAERLERGFGDQVQSIAAALALHFQRGRSPARAVHYLSTSAQCALRRSAYHEAIEQLTRAIALLGTLPESAERRGQELDLSLLLASPLRLTRGYAAPELTRLYARIAELAAPGASSSQMLLVLAGLAAYHLARAEYAAALEIGQRFLRMAEDAADDSALAEAHLVVGAACHFRGEQRRALDHLARVIAFHDAADGGSSASMISLDHGFAARGMVAYAHWLLGDAKRAREEIEQSTRRALELDNPVALAYASCYAATICGLCEDLDAMQEHQARLAPLAEQQGLQMFIGTSLLHQGKGLLARGQLSEGVEQVSRGLQIYTGTGTSAYASYWVCALARAHALLGQPHQALQLLDGMLGVDRARRELIWDADLLRVRGEILLQCGQDAPRVPASPQAGELGLSGEACLLRSLDIAREQGAWPLQLRAAIRLSQHRRACGDVAGARALLAEVCAAVPQGVAVEDRRRASTLHRELGGACGCPA